MMDLFGTETSGAVLSDRGQFPRKEANVISLPTIHALAWRLARRLGVGLDWLTRDDG